MSDTPEELDAKIAALKAIANPRVAEVVLVDWPAPDGAIWYPTVIADDILHSGTFLDQIDGPIELRLPNAFLDIEQRDGVSDDTVDLDFWDGDDEISRMAHTHGEGTRTEAFYYFPEVDLLLSHWWGHMRPPEDADGERFKCTAEFGFMSGSLPLPRRAFFTGCQAMFGGLLENQAEIDEGDCPYNRHLEGTTLDEFDPANGANVDATAGGPITKDAGGTAWNAGCSHSEAVDADDDATLEITLSGGYAAAGFFSTASPVSGNADCEYVLQWNPDGSVSIKHSGTLVVPNVTTWAPGTVLRIDKRNGRFRAYKGSDEILIQTFVPPAPIAPLYVGIAIQNVGAGVSTANVKVGDIGSAPAFGNLDPATSAPYTSCPRNNTAACVARLGDSKSYLAFDTILETHLVHETKGPNITVTSRGNETNLKRPLRVIAGRRHVTDMDLLTFTVEPNTKHPDEGSVKALFAASEGAIKSLIGGKINGNIIAPMHLNVRLGQKRQSQTSFSPRILNYSGTALFLGVAQGDFTKAGADDLRGEADIEGLCDVRVYIDAQAFSEQYSEDRAWWLLHALRNKRWGYGLDAVRCMIEDFIELSAWYAQIVSVTDKDGNTSTGPRSRFNAELIDRSAQQQISDMCLAGWCSLPFPDRGKLRVKPLRRAREIFSTRVFSDRAFYGALNRKPTDGELAAWMEDLQEALEIGDAELLAVGKSLLEGLFTDTEYTTLAASDEVYVEDLYQSYLNRQPDPAGLAGWLSTLGTETREVVRNGFADSDEFRLRMRNLPVKTFSDRGADRNICVDEETQKSTLKRTVISDRELVNRLVATYDDAAHNNDQVPLTFEDIDQQLAAGRAFGDFTRRAVEKQVTAFGVTDAGEAGRLGNLILDLGEFEEGGLKNNLRVTFVTWWLETVDLVRYQVIKVDSAKLERYGFTYFRIRSIRRMPDLKVEIIAQAYPENYYEDMELISTPPAIIPNGGPTINPGGGDRGIPTRVPFEELTHSDDRVRITLAQADPVV